MNQPADQGMEELIKGTEAKLRNEEYKNTVFAHPLPFNLIPHIDKFQVRIFSTVLLILTYAVSSYALLLHIMDFMIFVIDCICN